MTLQTAAGARAAFLAMVNKIGAFEGILEDDLDPTDLPEGSAFATLQEGGDFLLDTIVGGQTPQYEVYSVVNFDVLTRHKDKAEEAARRATIVAAIESDPYLDGAVDDIRIVRADNQTEPEEGAHKARASSITIELHYLSASPVG